MVEDGQYELSTGRYAPDWYLDEPPLQRGDDFYIRAFHALCTERQFGSAIGPIPWSKIMDYGQRVGLDPVMMSVFESVIYALDEAWLEDARNGTVQH